MVRVANDVVERIKLAPDAGLVNSLGANHTLESAIADLVDNSIDAGASRVSIRLLTRKDRLTQVEVLDNGKGMDARAANAAMTIGHQRDYTDGDLGHYVSDKKKVATIEKLGLAAFQRYRSCANQIHSRKIPPVPL